MTCFFVLLPQKPILMVAVHKTALALLVLQVYVSAAPSNTTKLEEIAKIEEPKLDSPPSPLDDAKKETNSTENPRQKRFYNHYGYGFPPINPVQYPTYNKRDQSSDLGVYGIDDPLSLIHRRLQEISSFTRQPPPPPPVPSQFPLFLPVIFVPQFGCACNPDSDTTTQSTARPDTTQPTSKPPLNEGGTTSPDIFNRWPEMEDERQNWGLVVNETDEDFFGDDFSRPISFDPIELNTSMSRPAPPVDHGSEQAGGQTGGQSTTTARPNQPSNEVSRPSSTNRPRPPNNNPPTSVVASAAAFASSAPYPSNSAQTPREAPTVCDGAVLSCCHQPQVSYDCFAVLGCPDPTSYGNPCDPLVILRVIGKYQKFYAIKSA